MDEPAAAGLNQRARLALGVQRVLCWMLAPLTLSAASLWLRGVMRLRFEDIRALREAYREDRRMNRGPLLVCANHLTMVDSFMIGYALACPAWYWIHFRSFPWNVPDRSVFASRFWQRALSYAFKCLPIERGGARSRVADTLARFAHLLRDGEVGVVFPEGGRSRSGRVEVESAAWGVGRVVRSADCRVLCVYLRGDAQQNYAAVPARGDTIRARFEWFEPQTDLRGVRASREVSRQILHRLAAMEQEHLAAA